MLAYALRRTLWAVPTILAVVTVCYLLLHFTPGGPFDTEKQLSAATLANLNAKYHLDEPLWKQYLLYLNALLHGDLGPSFRYVDWSVNDLVKKALPVSLGGAACRSRSRSCAACCSAPSRPCAATASSTAS